jgi:DNA-binding NarL/FixJ family response regulator
MKSAGSGRLGVAVEASDPVNHAGLIGCLRRRPELMVPATRSADADVVILAPTRLSVSVLADMRHAAQRNGTPVVLVVDEISEADLLTAIECRVVAVLPRAAATGERLLHSVLAAASGGGMLPPNLLGELLKHVERLQREIRAPHGLNSASLSPREIEMLRLMAEGMDTVEIAASCAIRSAWSRTLSSAAPPDGPA